MTRSIGTRSSGTRVVAALVGLVTVVALSMTAGCADLVVGRAASIYEDPFSVGGMAAVGGPSGPRSGVPNAHRNVAGGDGGAADTLVVNALTDIETYWKTEFRAAFGGSFRPVSSLLSWDSDDRGNDGRFCDTATRGVINAAYCNDDHTIGWDRGTLIPTIRDDFSPIAVVMVLAHEYGHAVQFQVGHVSQDTEGIVLEQQADCYAGTFIRSVAEGKSAHFTLNTSDGLNHVLAGLVAVRDDQPGAKDSIHGSAFERVTAFQFGFTDGAAACDAIDAREVASRRGDLPQAFSSAEDTGEWPVTQDSVTQMVAALQKTFALSAPPKLTFSKPTGPCHAGDAVVYCPGSNTLNIDLPALAEIGKPKEQQGPLPVSVSGDYSAYVLVASRFALAAQKEQGLSLTDSEAALRTACMAGTFTSAAAAGIELDAERGVALSAGDLDEAVSSLLTDGKVASDVDGATVPSGFSRVDAFRAGVLGQRGVCATRYPN